MEPRGKPTNEAPAPGSRVGGILSAPPPDAGGIGGSRPSISLPKAEGAIRGIGEKFSANPATGSGSLSFPIAASPGRSGFGPQLALSYDSGSRNGPFGFGWTMSLPSITRKTDKGLPQYDDARESDTFILSGAEDLVPVLVQDGSKWVREVLPTRTVYGAIYAIHRYRPRVDGLFSRIERWINTRDPADTFWRSITKDNLTTWYGRSEDSRIVDPDDHARVFSWLICESYDDKGNVAVYRYKPEDADQVDLTQANERNRARTNCYLKRVFYGNRTPYRPDLAAETAAALPIDFAFELVFDYGDHRLAVPLPSVGPTWTCRSDPFSSWRSGFEIRTYRLCRRALMFHHFEHEPDVGPDCLVRSTDFVYAPPPAGPRPAPYSFLQSVTQTSYRRVGAGYLARAMPSVEFGYSVATVDATVRELDPGSVENLPGGLDEQRYRFVDLDGEGLSGILSEQGGSWFYKANLSAANQQEVGGARVTLPRFAPVQVVARKPSTAALASQRLMDLSGDGQLDLVDFEAAVPGFFERTQRADWELFAAFPSLPTIDWRDPALKFIDLTGDGLPDLLISEADAFSWHRSLGEDGYGPAQRTRQALDEEQGPRLVFHDGTESIFLADMSGDGLTDLVRIRNGEVCYWPNRGYGRFGAKVTMDNAPWFDHPDQFDGRRLRLADIDGTGATDIIYLAAGAVHLYFNRSGNGFGARHVLANFPALDNTASVSTIDLTGSGTICLVWSSPLAASARRPMRYIDLMGGQKPHLLVRFANNLGTETRIQYAPSTKFYVADKLAGTPWVTRLPFPVQVVEQVQTYDFISRNLFVTRYAYHHGHFDGVEREFRGFGRVDQFDTEALASLSAASGMPQPVNLDAASNVPPVCTRTWFHTGVFVDAARVSRHLAHEYYQESDASDAVAPLSEFQLAAMLLDDTLLPADILLASGGRLAYDFSGEEFREACRALRGSVLRQEVYALDGTDAADRPYSVSERSYAVEALQPQGSNRFAVFFVHPRETLDFRYDRKLYKVNGSTLAAPDAPPPARTAADPRVSHAVTLSVDQFGNVLETVALGYGRRYLDPGLTPADQAKQRATLGTYVRNTYTTPVLLDDAYRAPLPAQASKFELIQLQPQSSAPDVTNLFRFDELRAAIDHAGDGAHDVAVEDRSPALNPGEPYRRLIGATRTLYRPDDLGAAAGDPRALLPLRGLEPLALRGATYRLAFTPGLIATYRRGGAALLPSPAAVLGSTAGDGGGYRDLDGDGRWWAPSGREYFVTAPDLAQEENQALAHFFLTRRFEDAFGNAGTIGYDGYDLLPLRTMDEVGNVVAAQNDYRVLAPAVLTDPNGNRSAVSFDCRGFVAATALMGKASQTVGDRLTGFTVDLAQADIDALHDAADPHTVAAPLIGNATSRLVYDLDRFANTRAAAPDDPTQWQPPFSATITRETHMADLAPGEQSRLQIAFSYSDGFGREIQKKVQAEPGPVDGGPAVDPRWVGSGWVIFNNKGKPVRQYEPFFSRLPKGHQFEFGAQAGVSPIALYDPVQRLVVTLNANQTWQKVVFDPWHQDTWDVNDTVLIDPAADPDAGAYFARLAPASYAPTWYAQRAGGPLGPVEQDAAAKAAAHAATPTITYFDSLGRTVRTTMDNAGNTIDARFELDVQGHQLSITDALGRIVIVSTYDLLANRIAQASMDSGNTWMLDAASGNAIRAWDSRGHDFATTYDAMRRPIALTVRGNDPANSDPRTLATRVVYEKIEYGEEQAHDTDLNLRGRVFRHYDGAGVLANVDVDPATGLQQAFDFKGNLLRSRRSFIDDAGALPDWSAPPLPFAPDTFAQSTQYDALNRPIATTGPDGSVIRPSYNAANLLEAVAVNLRGGTATAFVTNIDHNAKGQRLRIDYANHASTTYTYDPAMFRLTRVTTTRKGVPADQAIVQDLSYTYDPAGNITHIRDDADIHNVVFFANRRVEPSTDFTYDAVYRLIQASGREQLGLAAGAPNAPAPTSYNDLPRVHLVQPGDGNAMGLYGETYQYDLTGNLAQLRHTGSNPANPGWTRTYTYAQASLLEPARMGNRLSNAAVSGSATLAEPYAYDVRGNMTAMPHLHAMLWDFKDQLAVTQRQAVNTADQDGTAHQGERTTYVYDFSGQRVRKVTVSAAGTKLKERFYVGGFELYREYGVNALERQTLHVMDDRRRIALVETKTADTQAPAASLPATAIRYLFNNHLGTALLELDQAGAVVSYEEYYPFGGTAYQAGRSLAEVSLKRYRYLGQERDEETGFNYMSARYYAPWLARWTSPDPAGLTDGPNPYWYARDNPVMLADPGGKDPQPGQGFSVGPFQFSNIQGEANLNVSFDVSLNNLFSSDRSLTVNSLFAGGQLKLVADTTLTPFGFTGRSVALLNLDQLHIDHQFFSASLSANATLAAGPFALDLNADATGTSVIDRNISLSAPRDQLAAALDDFQGSANLSGRFFLRAGPINRALGYFSMTADSKGSSGVLGFRGYLGLPTLDPGRNINIARIRGEGTFGPGGYDLHGTFNAALPPVAFAFGRFDLSSDSGFSASGHYFGPQFGPLGLTPDIDPLAFWRPANIASSPSDEPDTRLSGQLSLPERHMTGPDFRVRYLDPGFSVGYTYFNTSRSGTTIFSAGFSPHAQYTDTSPTEPPLPSVLGAVPGLDTLLYGHPQQTDAGVYFGVSLTRTFWTF